MDILYLATVLSRGTFETLSKNFLHMAYLSKTPTGLYSVMSFDTPLPLNSCLRVELKKVSESVVFESNL